MKTFSQIVLQMDGKWNCIISFGFHEEERFGNLKEYYSGDRNKKFYERKRDEVLDMMEDECDPFCLLFPQPPLFQTIYCVWLPE